MDSGKLKYSRFHLFIIFSFAALPGLFAAGAVEDAVTIQAYRQVVNTWEGPWPAYVITFNDGREVHWIWGIKGFSEFSDGTEYRVNLRKKSIPNPPVDTPDTEFILTEVLSRKEVPMIRDVRIPLSDIQGPFVTFRKDEGWMLVNEIPLLLSSGLTEEELVLALWGSLETIGIFEIIEGQYILSHLEYEFLPEFFLDRLFFSGGTEPDDETVEFILNSTDIEIREKFSDQLNAPPASPWFAP